MGRLPAFAVVLASLLPLVARADYYVLEGDVLEGGLPARGDRQVGAWGQTHGLAMIETSGVSASGAEFHDELRGTGRFGARLALLVGWRRR